MISVPEQCSAVSQCDNLTLLCDARMDLSSPTDCGGGFDDLFLPRSSQLTTAGEDLLLYGRSVSSDTSSSGRENSTNTRLDRLDRCLTLPPPPAPPPPPPTSTVVLFSSSLLLCFSFNYLYYYYSVLTLYSLLVSLYNHSHKVEAWLIHWFYFIF